jgi:hypothetical protein
MKEEIQSTVTVHKDFGLNVYSDKYLCAHENIWKTKGMEQTKCNNHEIKRCRALSTRKQRNDKQEC